MLSTALEIIGFCLVVAAAYFVALPLALLVAGVAFVFVAQGLEPKPEPKR